MDQARQDIRFSLPSKGRLAGETMQFLDAAGLNVVKPNPRQLTAHIPALLRDGEPDSSWWVLDGAEIIVLEDSANGCLSVQAVQELLGEHGLHVHDHGGKSLYLQRVQAARAGGRGGDALPGQRSSAGRSIEDINPYRWRRRDAGWRT